MTSIETIRLPLPLCLGTVNAYLLAGQSGSVLIDSGGSKGRRTIRAALQAYTPTLRLIVLTHGDLGHTGNAAYLRGRLGVPLAMHAGDALMGTTGSMQAGRATRSVLLGPVSTRLFGFRRSDRFEPDRLLDDGDSLAPWGLEATVLHLPGHSSGSLGILTSEGDLFCGDLLENNRRPMLNSIMDDLAAAWASVERPRCRCAGSIPGMGSPLRWTRSSCPVSDFGIIVR